MWAYRAHLHSAEVELVECGQPRCDVALGGHHQRRRRLCERRVEREGILGLGAALEVELAHEEVDDLHGVATTTWV